MLDLLCYLTAFVLFVLAGLNVVIHPRVNALGFGLAAAVLPPRVAAFQPVT